MKAFDRVKEELVVYTVSIATINEGLQKISSNPHKFDELHDLVPDIDSYVSVFLCLTTLIA